MVENFLDSTPSGSPWFRLFMVLFHSNINIKTKESAYDPSTSLRKFFANFGGSFEAQERALYARVILTREKSCVN